MYSNFHPYIKEIMSHNHMWKGKYDIKDNKKNGGQSLCFPIKDEDKTIYIAKYFDYMKDIPNNVVKLNNQKYKDIEEFEQAIAEASISEDVEAILNSIYYKKRSFDRYIEICQGTVDIFPKVYVFDSNIRIDDRFYGLLIEEYIEGEILKDIISSIDRKQEDIAEYAINFLDNTSKTLKKYSEAKIVHRDISPDNIIVSNSGNIVIIDPRSNKDYR